MTTDAESVELYRRYRPTKFSEVVGQVDAMRMLNDMGKRKAIPHVLLLSGPSGCLRGDSVVYDPMDGSSVSIQDRWRRGVSFHVLSLNDAGVVEVGVAFPPVKYSDARMFRVETDQSVFYATEQHQLCLFDSREYLSLKECFQRLHEFGEVRLLSNLEHGLSTRLLDESRCLEIKQDFQGDCPACSYSCDEQLLPLTISGRLLFPLQDGVLGYSHCCLPMGVLGCGLECNQICQYIDRLSTSRFWNHNLRVVAMGFQSVSTISGLLYDYIPSKMQFRPLISLFDTTAQLSDQIFHSTLVSGQGGHLGRVRKHLSACHAPVVGEQITGWSIIKNITEVKQEEYFDFHVPVYNNYWMGGIFHHNCGKTTIARILKGKIGCNGRDFIEMNSAQFRGIDTIRELSVQMGYAPLLGRCRVWLIDEVHQLTPAAQDGFLKVLEDTPSHVYFFLCTTDPEKLKKTVVTRCTEIKLQSVSFDALQNLVQRTAHAEGQTKISTDVIDKIAEVADGSARKALVLLHQVIGLGDEDAQLDTLEKADTKRNAIELYRMLSNASTQWSKVAKLLKVLDDDPEQLRNMILACACNGLLANKNTSRSAMIIEEFRENFFYSRKAGLAAACYAVVSGP